MADWHFVGAKGIKPQGMNNGDIDMFRGAPIRSLAREICQNSLDALPEDEKVKRANGEAVDPVTIEFRVFNGRVPKKETLLCYVKKMRSYWDVRQKNDKSVVDFLGAVITNLSKDTIPFLRISDYRTTGLNGINKDGTPWDNLVSAGASDKHADDGGSKGVGHAAPFACSDIQTVFYYTLNTEREHGFEGVSRLVGWKDDPSEDAVGYVHDGYYGNGELCQTPINDCILEGNDFERKEVGADVYIAGFSHADWEQEVIRSAIDSFLLAFYAEKLVVRVGRKEISGENLPSCIDGCISSGGSFTNHADQYYRVLTSPNSKTFTLDDPEGIKGQFSLKLLVDSALDVRRVALVRDTGMLIFEQGRINASIKFAGVLEVKGSELNAFLRKLENGQHTEWSAARAKPEDKQKAEDLLKTIGKFCRRSLLSMNEIKPGEKLDSGLGSTSNKGDNVEGASAEEEEDVTDELKPIARQKAIKQKRDAGSRKKKKKVKVEREDGDGGTTGGENPTQPPPAPPGPHPADPPDPQPPKDNPVKWADVEASDLDYVCIDKAKSEYQIVFTPDSGFEHGMVKLYVMAETEAYCANVLSAQLDDGTTLIVTRGNTVEGLEFVKGKPVSITVTLDYTDYCSLEVEAYGHN